MYEDYRQWCGDRGFKPLDATNFGKELRKVFPQAERRRETKGERPWKYHGLRAVGPTASSASKQDRKVESINGNCQTWPDAHLID